MLVNHGPARASNIEIEIVTDGPAVLALDGRPLGNDDDPLAVPSLSPGQRFYSPWLGAIGDGQPRLARVRWHDGRRRQQTQEYVLGPKSCSRS